MEWWHCGPVVLAVILFLLVGTVIERQIETTFQRIVSRHLRPMLASAEVETLTERELASQGLEHPATPAASQKSIHSAKSRSVAETTVTPIDATGYVVVNGDALQLQQKVSPG